MDRLAQRAQLRRYGMGDVILRAGEASTELHGLVSGAARVELPGAAARRLVLAPPQSFGEMSALSGNAVSATIVAQGDTETWVLAGTDLFEVLGEEPAFFRNVSALLGERLRHRTRDTAFALQPTVTALVADATVNEPMQVLQALHAGVRHYSPASQAIDGRRSDTESLATRIRQWRDQASGSQILMMLIRKDQLDELAPLMEAADFALHVVGGNDGRAAGESFHAGAADVATLRLGARLPVGCGERWTHVLDVEDLGAVGRPDGAWVREDCPVLDRLVRQICGREIGLALSVGAAAGLAHLGLLETLEDTGVPLDFLCGSSMGGIVSMGYAYFGNARAATDAFCHMAADFARSRGLHWLPRASLVSPARMEAIFRDLFGSSHFAELNMPVAVIAADLVASRRVVLDTGSLSVAARATGAIPGLFPPVRLGNAMLVDGGLVTRVPVDLLATRRSGLRLAALIKPQRDTTSGHAAVEGLQSRLERPFGLRTAIAASWSLLGWWDSAAQAERADVVVRISTPSSDGFNFGAGQALIDRGRQAAQSHLPAIKAAVERTLRPGVP